MARLASSGSGERAGGSSGGGFRPGIQARHWSRKAEDAGKHFFFCRVYGCTRGKSDEREVGRDCTYAVLQLSVKHGKPRSRCDDHVNGLLTT